jgi:hypothetical protein
MAIKRRTEESMSVKVINIGKDFTRIPGGRYRKYGPYSGEEFREEVLVPALKGHDCVTVYLDDVETYMSSFLEEAFGGLIRKEHFSYDDLKTRLTVAAQAKRYQIFLRKVAQDMLDAANAPPDEKSPKVA